MEGVLVAALRPLIRFVDGALQCKIASAKEGVMRCVKPNAKRRKTSHGEDDAWVSWVDVASFIRSVNIHVDVLQVERMLRAPVEVDVSSDDELPGRQVEALQTRVHVLENENMQLTRKTVSSVRANRRLKTKVLEFEEPKADINFCKVFSDGRDAEGRYFSPRAGLSVAVRRMATQVSSRKFGLANAMDIHHTTVNRWEVMFNACLQASRKAWYSDREQIVYAELETPAQPHRRMRYVTHTHKGDATNTTKFKVKYHTTESKSIYFEMDAEPTTSWAELVKSKVMRKGLGDLLEVKEGGALATYALYEKQIKSQGCPVWNRGAQALATAARLAATSSIFISISIFSVPIVAETRIKRNGWLSRRAKQTCTLISLALRVYATSTT
jgi:hypothetical protein